MNNIIINNKRYTYISINGLYWLQQNLDISSMDISSEYYYYNNRDTHVNFGYMYNWNIANNLASNIKCELPSGWRLPTKSECLALINLYGGDEEAGGSLKSISLLWTQNTGATNSSELTVLPAGYRDPIYNNLKEIGYTARIWTATQYNNKLAWCMELYGASTNANIVKVDKTIQCSIRLVKTI